MAIVKCPNCEELDDKKLQRIANELWFSETCFILSDKQPNGGYDIRIFTPHEEVEFSGHPLLGAAFIINQNIEKSPQKKIILNIKGTAITVDLLYKNDQIESLWLENLPPFFSPRIFEPILLSKVLGIEFEDIEAKYPIVEVSTGLPFVIVPIRNLNVIKQIQINKERYEWFIQRIKAKCILAFTTETESPENHLHVRVFADALGIPEDSATGSGNGSLAAYLVKYKFQNKSELDLRIEQGYEIHRPSIILAKGKQEGDAIKVQIGGQVVVVAEGKLL